MAYGYFKDLAIRTTLDKVLCDKAFNVAINPKYDGYQGDLASIHLQINLLNLLLNKMNSYLENCTNQLLENVKKEKYIHH